MTEVVLRPRLVTAFHRELVTVDWLQGLHATLENFLKGQKASFSGILVALYTHPRNLGPESAVKYRFVAVLHRSPTSVCRQRFTVHVHYVPHSARFKLSDWGTRYQIRGSSPDARPLLVERILTRWSKGESLPARQLHDFFLTWGEDPKSTAYARSVLPLQITDGFLVVGVTSPTVLPELARESCGRLPIQAVLLEPDEMQALLSERFGPRVHVQMVSINVHDYPVGTRVPDKEPIFRQLFTSPGYRIWWKRALEEPSFSIQVRPGRIVLTVIGGGQGPHETCVPIAARTFSRLDALSREAMVVPVPCDFLHPWDSWSLQRYENGALQERTLGSPVWSPFMKFCLDNLRRAGVRFTARRKSRII